MVSFNKLALFGALATAVMALPVTEPEDAALELEYDSTALLAEANALFASSLAAFESNSSIGIWSTEVSLATYENDELIKRSIALGPLFVLLSNVVVILAKPISNLLALRLSAGSVALEVRHLTVVNQFLLKLETALQAFSIRRGLAGAIQTLLISTGLQSLILGLNTVVSTIVSLLLTNAKVDPLVKAQLFTLNNHLTTLASEFSSLGSSGSGLTSLSSVLGGALSKAK